MNLNDFLLNHFTDAHPITIDIFRMEHYIQEITFTQSAWAYIGAGPRFTGFDQFALVHGCVYIGAIITAWIIEGVENTNWCVTFCEESRFFFAPEITMNCHFYVSQIPITWSKKGNRCTKIICILCPGIVVTPNIDTGEIIAVRNDKWQHCPVVIFQISLLGTCKNDEEILNENMQIKQK